MRYFAIVLIFVSCSSFAQTFDEYAYCTSESAGTAYSKLMGFCTSAYPGRVYELSVSGTCSSGNLTRYLCRAYVDSPCPSGESWVVNSDGSGQCQGPQECGPGQQSFNGVCADVGECDTGEQVVLDSGQSLLQACDGAQECDEGFYWHSATESCYGPDDESSSSSDSSSSDSSSSDSSSSDGSTSSSGDGGSTSSGDGGSTSSGSDIDLSEVVSELNEANEHLQDISDSLDVEGASFDGSVSPGVQSLYESEYPNGVAGVWEAQKTALMDTPVFGFMNQFQFDYNDTSLPVWSMCFDLGSMGNFGCKDLTVPAYVWAFVKIVMLVSTAFLCRRLIFGG